jgi:hypothetical protein
MKTDSSPLPGQLDLFAKDTEPSALNITAAAVLDLEAKDSSGAPRRPTFSILAYTGAPIRQAWSSHPVIVDLAGIKAAREKIPILLDHDPGRIVGQGTPTIDAESVRIAGTITGDDADASKVVTHARNGFEWQASIGASVARHEFLKAGEKTTVNGREVTGPILIARETRLKETSFVAIGADSQTTAAVAASSPPGTPKKGASTVFETWLEAKGIDPTALDDTVKGVLRASYEAEQKPPPAPEVKAAEKPTASLEAIMGEIRAEEQRKAKITKIAADAARERPGMADEFERLARTAIEAKNSVEEFDLTILRIRADAPRSFAIHGGDRQASAKVLEAAVCIAGSLDNIEKHFDERTLNAASDRFPRGLGLRDLFLIHARQNGYSGHDSTDIRGILRTAFADGGESIRATGFSTNSLSGILGATANKFLTMGFNAVEDSWRSITSIGSARDFKTMTRYALTGDFIYEKVGPAGELKHATLGELSYTQRVETYGKMFAITRQDLINDDLNALTGIPQRLGRGAALKLNDVFYTTYLAGVGSFWAAGNNNLITGGTTVLSDAGLTAATLKFRQQTDPDGRPTAITPRILLVPPELEVTAAQLMTSTQVNTGGAATDTRVPNANVWSGKFRVVSSVYLSNSAYTGYSTTAWFLLADPNDLPTIETAFLNGKQTPTVESADADFDQLGVQFRGYHDFGVALQEKRASVRSAGA